MCFFKLLLLVHEMKCTCKLVSDNGPTYPMADWFVTSYPIPAHTPQNLVCWFVFSPLTALLC